MPTIKFNYFYRDSANYKKFGFVIFENTAGQPLAELETLTRSKLIYETYFYPEEWHLPVLYLETFDFKIDPTWHEFESIELSKEKANSRISLKGFVTAISKTNWIF